MSVTLVQIGHSPWSEKARWALDHHRISYRRIEYLTMIGEPILRLRLRGAPGRGAGPATVPVLIDRDRIYADSWTIAHHADAVGAGAPLFPPDAIDAVREIDQRAERLMNAGRARTAARTLESPRALQEALPPPLRMLGPAGLPIAKLGARFLQRKYRADSRSLEDHERTMDDELAALRSTLGERDYFVDDAFSFADVAVASAMQFVAPIAFSGMRLGEATRAAWTEIDLARRYDDLVAWRDRIYARHR